ncbi:MAG TPA: hypothetical protein VM388_00035 [Acidimicrobiales bacterium]|nr:hypothetical protein [Acidimicrobiales bacterium]HWI03812.1 hypothetical protein [Acidimicrobiales bacterium]
MSLATDRVLGRRARRGVLTVHILGAGAWIGIDVVLGVLVLTAVLTESTATEALCYRVLELFAVWPLLTAGLATLASGVVLGLGTNYGLIRYWWVAVKLILNVILVALVAFALRPGLAEAAAYGELLAAGGSGGTDAGNLVFPPVVSGMALVTATSLSVFKPWGRLRRAR